MYKTIATWDLEALDADVTAAQEEGWEVHGAQGHVDWSATGESQPGHRVTFLQAMTKDGGTAARRRTEERNDTTIDDDRIWMAMAAPSLKSVKYWVAFIVEEGGMGHSSASSPQEVQGMVLGAVAARYRESDTAKEAQEAMAWSENSKAGDRFGFANGVIVDVTGGWEDSAGAAPRARPTPKPRPR